MKVLLLKDFDKLGKKDDVVDVNDGYARNFLLPKGIATLATKSVIKEYKERIKKEERLEQEKMQEALQLRETLNQISVDVAVKCGDGKMYGSVTTQDIADGLAKQDINVDKRKITINDPIKELGEYSVDVWLYKETIAKLKINVIKAE